MGDLAGQAMRDMIDELNASIESLRIRNSRLERQLRDSDIAGIHALAEINDLKRAAREAGGDFRRLRHANLERNREWDPEGAITIPFRSLEMTGESGELAEAALRICAAVGKASNILKKMERERLGIRGSRATLDDLRQELADVIITCDLLGMTTGIDLWAAIADTFNNTSEKNNLSVRL